jgi:hypothetical protein
MDIIFLSHPHYPRIIIPLDALFSGLTWLSSYIWVWLRFESKIVTNLNFISFSKFRNHCPFFGWIPPDHGYPRIKSFQMFGFFTDYDFSLL